MSKPFKMQGHELPGPNQSPSALKRAASDDDYNQYRRWGVTTQFEDEGGASGDFGRKRGESYADAKTRISGERANTSVRSSGATNSQDTLNTTPSGEQAQYIDSGIEDSYSSDIPNQEGTTVPVDVEVTVNGNPV